jgi:hypothetical protein
MNKRRLWVLIAAALMASVLTPSALAKSEKANPPPEVRFATYNASLNRLNLGDLGAELAVPGSAQADDVAEIIQRTRPDVLLINEFDYDPQALADFQTNYLGVDHGDADAIFYPYTFIAPSNTGVFSGFDYDNSGAAGDFVPGDSYGFGFFPGQFGMAVLSMYPIDYDSVRTFQLFKWKDMPGALLPDDPSTGLPADWYTPGPELDSFRLSSKSHWDVPIDVDGRTVHFLVSHPTPPVFDDPPFYPAGVDFNGRRNHDEIRFWADYVDPARSGYIYDDDGVFGGLDARDRFVIAGDQNSDPLDGDSIPGSAQLLLNHPKINGKSGTPSSEGGPEQSALQGGDNATHLSDPAFDTADFGEPPGNLRADYVLPRKNMKIADSGVFWPLSTDPLFSLISASDHRLVWIDVRVT